MKRSIPFLLLGLWIFSAATFAQRPETFDVTTFQPPKGWQMRTGADAVQFSTEDKTSGAFCIITLFKSVSGIGDSKQNFDAAWQTIVKGEISASAGPQMLPADNKDGWEIASGFAGFEKDGAKGAALLVTASGSGKMVNVLVLTTADVFEKDIAAFLASVKLKKPEAVDQPQTPASTNGSQPSLTQYFWKQSQSRKDIGGYAGYSANTYQFFSNNTYKFSGVTFQNYSPKYYLENEEGTYKVTGNTITITPKKAVFSSHKSKKEDPPLKTGNLGLATVQYRFEIMNLNNNWTLLLSPVDGNETKRDGTFSFWMNGEARRTYSYNSVNAQGELIR